MYAREPGSAAAPTAGLHFTPELLDRLDPVDVTLHVGLDTFRPVTEATSRGACAARRAVRGRCRRVGADRRGRARSRGWNDIGAGRGDGRAHRRAGGDGRRSSSRPGFEFRRVDLLLTNFHLPRSTLLALVMAFAGVERTLELYRVGDRGAVPLLLVRRRDAGPGHVDGPLVGAVIVTGPRRAGALPDRGRREAPTGRPARAPSDRARRHPDPAFMPVGTKATVKSLHPDEVRALGATIVLGNTYHLHFRPGEESSRSSAACTLLGLGRADPHRLGRFPGLLLRDTILARRDGVTFRSVYDGRGRGSPPGGRREIQAALGSDIAMCLDVCQPAESLARGARARGRARTSAVGASSRPTRRVRPGQLLFGITQGGADVELRRRSIEEICALPFDGYALGGLAVGEESRSRDARLRRVGGARAPRGAAALLHGHRRSRRASSRSSRGASTCSTASFRRARPRTGSALTWEGRLNLRNAGSRGIRVRSTRSAPALPAPVSRGRTSGTS